MQARCNEKAKGEDKIRKCQRNVEIRSVSYRLTFSENNGTIHVACTLKLHTQCQKLNFDDSTLIMPQPFIMIPPLSDITFKNITFNDTTSNDATSNNITFNHNHLQNHSTSNNITFNDTISNHTTFNNIAFNDNTSKIIPLLKISHSIIITFDDIPIIPFPIIPLPITPLPIISHSIIPLSNRSIRNCTLYSVQ